MLDVARRMMLREIAGIEKQLLETTSSMQTGRWPGECLKEIKREDNSEKKQADIV